MRIWRRSTWMMVNISRAKCPGYVVVKPLFFYRSSLSGRLPPHFADATISACSPPLSPSFLLAGGGGGLQGTMVVLAGDTRETQRPGGKQKADKPKENTEHSRRMGDAWSAKNVSVQVPEWSSCPHRKGCGYGSKLFTLHHPLPSLSRFCSVGDSNGGCVPRARAGVACAYSTERRAVAAPTHSTATLPWLGAKRCCGVMPLLSFRVPNSSPSFFFCNIIRTCTSCVLIGHPNLFHSNKPHAHVYLTPLSLLFDRISYAAVAPWLSSA